MDTVEDVLDQCFHQGRSQTLLLLGLTSHSFSLRLTSHIQLTYSHVIHLSVTGSLFPDELPAVELLTKQLSLSLNQTFQPSDSLSVLKTHLKPGHNLVLTLHEAENYAHKGQQRLLYSLLELVNEIECGMLLVLQSIRLDFTELLEKRLKSRLNAKPICCMQEGIETYKGNIVAACSQVTGSEEWKQCMDTFLGSMELTHYYALGKSVEWVRYLFQRAFVENLRYNNARVSLERVMKEETVGLTVTFLKELPQYEMAVLLAHACTERNNGFTNFDLAYSWLKSHPHSGVLTHSRRSFFRVSTRMLALGFLEKQNRYANDELAVMHLQLETDELFSLIQSGEIKGLTLFGAWIRSSH